MEIPDVNALERPTVCLYCHTYAKIQSDYPVNPATYAVDSEVPRCETHAQFTCDSCEKDIHFNGITYCVDCEVFTCLRCGIHTITKEKFLVYDFYYAITCATCGLELETLEYTETTGEHPFQIGAVRPQSEIQVWLPIGQEVEYQPQHKAWGLKRLQDMAIPIKYEPVDEKAGDSKEVWDANAELWKELTRLGDINHREIIIPKMLQYLDPESKIVMDIACGEGNFTRYMARDGYQITGTDVSKLIDYAIETENEEPLGINYKKVGVHQLEQQYDKDSFEQVTMNMAIMDIDNLDKILQNVKHILQPGGQFVFSLTHPITSWPVVRSIKLPRDSQKNIDKGWLVDNYADEQPMKVHMPDMPAPMLYYPRKISTYVNALVKHGFVITAMDEPVPDQETIMKHPRDMYQDYERNPIFLIFQTRLLPS